MAGKFLNAGDFFRIRSNGFLRLHGPERADLIELLGNDLAKHPAREEESISFVKDVVTFGCGRESDIHGLIAGRGCIFNIRILIYNENSGRLIG